MDCWEWEGRQAAQLRGSCNNINKKWCDMDTLICIKWITNQNLLYKKINTIKFKNSKKKKKSDVSARMGMEKEIQENSNTITLHADGLSTSEKLQYCSNIPRSWNDDSNYIQESNLKFWILYLFMASKEESWAEVKALYQKRGPSVTAATGGALSVGYTSW